MHENILATAARMSDRELVTRLASLSICERDATVELVAHLAELDARRGHLAEGPGTLFAYCHEILGYSEDAAWNRAAAATAVRRYPVILEGLADGSLNLTTVRMLRPILTAENHKALLDEARNRSKREVEVIVRRFDPKPDVASSIRRIPVQSVLASPMTGRPATQPRPVIAPLTPERYRVEFTISKEIHDKLRDVQELLCREVPNGDPALIFERALDVLLATVEKKKRGATPNPRRPSVGTPRGRRIPAHVARIVWARDGRRCAFVGTMGRCTQRRYLELHHVEPFAYQGPPTVKNIAVRCRAHNVYESELVFGRFDPSATRRQRQNQAISGQNTPVPERVDALPAWARSELRM